MLYHFFSRNCLLSTQRNGRNKGFQQNNTFLILIQTIAQGNYFASFHLLKQQHSWKIQKPQAAIHKLLFSFSVGLQYPDVKLTTAPLGANQHSFKKIGITSLDCIKQGLQFEIFCKKSMEQQRRESPTCWSSVLMTSFALKL